MADNLNITPEMVDNLMSMLKNSNSFKNPNNEKNSNNPNNPSNNNSKQSNEIDIETIMKIKDIMDSINNKNDKDTNLLYSLKPYLRKSRQDKIDQYANILKISQVSKLFRNGNGDT